MHHAQTKRSHFGALSRLGALTFVLSAAACSAAPTGDAETSAAELTPAPAAAQEASELPDIVCRPPFVRVGNHCIIPHPPPCHSVATCCVEGGGTWDGHVCE
jgi:hypothetical protein